MLLETLGINNKEYVGQQNDIMCFSTYIQYNNDVISFTCLDNSDEIDVSSMPSGVEKLNEFHTYHLSPIRSLERYFVEEMEIVSFANSVNVGDIFESTDFTWKTAGFGDLNTVIPNIVFGNNTTVFPIDCNYNLILNTIPLVKDIIEFSLIEMNAINIKPDITQNVILNISYPILSDINQDITKVCSSNIAVNAFDSVVIFTFVVDNHRYYFNTENKNSYTYSDEFYFTWDKEKITIPNKYTYDGVQTPIDEGFLRIVEIDDTKYLNISAIEIDIKKGV